MTLSLKILYTLIGMIILGFGTSFRASSKEERENESPSVLSMILFYIGVIGLFGLIIYIIVAWLR